jgi:hypothetical protein
MIFMDAPAGDSVCHGAGPKALFGSSKIQIAFAVGIAGYWPCGA